MKKIKKNILDAIDYLQNNPKNSITQTAILFNVDRHTLSDYVSKRSDYPQNNLFISKKEPDNGYLYFFTNEELEIIEYYKEYSHLGYPSLKEKFPNAPDVRAIRRWMDILGYSYSTGALKKYNYDRNKFNEIKTEEDAYWLGFITADGCIVQNKWLQIKLQASDVKHLEKFCKFMGMPNEQIQEAIKDEVGGAYTRDNPVKVIKISSIEVIKNLQDKGIYPRKSGNEIPYKCSSIDLEKAYIRGLIDGDGYLSSTDQNGIGIVGSYAICNYVKNFIQKNLVDVSPNRISEHGTIYRFEVRHHEKSQKIISYLYKNSNVYLDRKYKLYLEKYQ